MRSSGWRRQPASCRSAVFRTARALQETDQTLWPKAAKGGGRGAAHLEPRHLVNLVLALALADPIAIAPQTVAFRSMACAHPRFRSLTAGCAPGDWCIRRCG